MSKKALFLSVVGALTLLGLPPAAADDAQPAPSARPESPCPPPPCGCCVCRLIPARCETRQRVVECPAVTRQVCVPCYEQVDVPVYETKCTPRYRDVEVAVYATREVPCTEERCTPVWKDVEVPCYDTRQVPVYDTRRVPQYTEVDVPDYCTREVPVMREVCDPCTGEKRMVQCGTRTEEYQSGSHKETVLCGYADETFQCGWRCETYQSGTRTEQEFCGWKTETVQVGTRTETYQSGTRTEKEYCGDVCEVVQTGTCPQTRFAGYRTETEVVRPATTATVEEVVQVPARHVTVTSAKPSHDVKPLPGTEVVLTEAEYQQAMTAAGVRN